MLLKYYIQSVITQMLPNRCHELNKSAWRPHKHWVSKYILSLKLPNALTYLLITWCFFKAFRACFIQIIPLIYRFGRNRYHTGITEYHALIALFYMVLAPCNSMSMQAISSAVIPHSLCFFFKHNIFMTCFSLFTITISILYMYF